MDWKVLCEWLWCLDKDKITAAIRLESIPIRTEGPPRSNTPGAVPLYLSPNHSFKTTTSSYFKGRNRSLSVSSKYHKFPLEIEHLFPMIAARRFCTSRPFAAPRGNTRCFYSVKTGSIRLYIQYGGIVVCVNKRNLNNSFVKINADNF